MWRRLPDREGLLLVGPAAPTPDAGDHFEAAKAFGVRTGGTTMSTHRSRARPHSSGSTPSTSSANLQGGPQTAVTIYLTVQASCSLRGHVRYIHRRLLISRHYP